MSCATSKVLLYCKRLIVEGYQIFIYKAVQYLSKDGRMSTVG